MKSTHGSPDPEIVVGIDFGMTCTGVAYSMAPEWARPTTIQHWPGKLGHENRNKVATAVGYDPRTNTPISWGFLVDDQDPNLDVQSYFKLYLDPTHRDEFRQAPAVEEARRWFVDYLRFIYQAITNHFDDTYPRWSSKHIEFLFSVPTTWKNPGMIGEIQNLIRQAGFGQRPNHTAMISLTEAEAAAVYASKQQYHKGEVFLVCDIGGGTTDINVLKVTSNTLTETLLEPLSYVEGKAIGSSLIDYQMEEQIVHRLGIIQQALRGDPATIAEQMMASGDRFETFKCSFGSEALQTLDLLLPVPGFQPGQDLPQAGVWNGSMVVTKQDLQHIFDEQVGRIMELIDVELQKLQTEHPAEQISYIVLSGGLGSSPYVKQCLKRRYQMGNSGLRNTSNLTVLTALEPQLAVVHGVVLARSQELRNSRAVFQETCCRNSYGVLVRVPFEPFLHQGEHVVTDPRDGKKYAERQIDWIIKQGQRVSVADGVRKEYSLKINLGMERVPWRTQIVMSTLPASSLPRSMRGGAHTVCVVESMIDGPDMKLKNRHWYNLSKQYWLADFDLKILIGPADLKFQLWGRNRQLSKDHEEISVQWNPADTSTDGVAEADALPAYRA